MAFPTTSVITEFTGSDEDPLSEGGTWSTPVFSVYGVATKRASNQAAGTGFSSGYYNVATYLESETFATYATLPGNAQELALYGRITAPDTGSAGGYMLYYLQGGASGNWYMVRVHNALQYYVGSAPFSTTALSGGEQVGLNISGSGASVALDLYLDGVFEVGVVDTHADRKVAAGYIGIGGTSTVWRLDSFGGGEIVTVAVDTALPDADVTTTGWTTTPLWSKVNDASDSTVITATAA